MKLPTPDCPWCSRRVEDRGDRFACVHCAGEPPLPAPAVWYRDLAAGFGANAAVMMEEPSLPRYAYREGCWAARAAMRADPGLRP